MIGKQKISLHLMQEVADHFNVSLTAALLKMAPAHFSKSDADYRRQWFC
jgi:hypothetical protein